MPTTRRFHSPEPFTVDERRLRHAAGAFMNGYASWTWWATLTFRDAIGRALADRALKMWLRIVACTVDSHVPFASATGPQARGVPHFHVLLGIQPDGRFDAATGKNAWRRAHRLGGIAFIEPFAPGGPAPWYLARHPEWDVNVACPRPPACRRRTGCILAPGAW